MLDRFGWQLEIGDAVTVNGIGHGTLHMHGAQGFIAETDGENVLLQLTTGPFLAGAGELAAVRPQHLEYGHIGPAEDAELLAKAARVFAASCMQDATEAAVEDNIITADQAAQLMTTWHRLQPHDFQPRSGPS